MVVAGLGGCCSRALLLGASYPLADGKIPVNSGAQTINEGKYAIIPEAFKVTPSTLGVRLVAPQYPSPGCRISNHGPRTCRMAMNLLS